MKGKRSLLLVLLLVSACLPVSAAVHAQAVPKLGMGYDAASVVPVSQGVPVYTIGDQLWVESYYNQSINVELIAPGTSNVTASEVLNPYSQTLMLTFAPADRTGEWNVVAVPSVKTFVAQSITLNPLPVIPSPEVSNYGITPNGNLTLSFSMDLGSAYLGEGCVTGSAAPSLGVIPFPSSVGSGTLDVNLTTGVADLQSLPAGSGSSTSYFDFWIELYYPYAYASPSDQAQLTTSDVLVAQTAPVTFPASGVANASAALTLSAPLRQGRFELRAFFRDAAGLHLYSDTLLLDGGRWVWFSDCADKVGLVSSFSFTQSLSAPVEHWASGLYYAAFLDGVEAVGFTPISLNLTRVALQVAPYGGDLPSSVVASATGAGISNYTYYDGSLYLALDRVPSQVDVFVGYQGVQPDLFVIPIATGRNSTSFEVPFGQLSVTATSNGAGFSNAEVLVNATRGSGPNVATEATSGAGTSFFVLLGGNYSVTLRSGGFTETETVRVVPGNDTTLGFVVPYSPNLTLPYLLLGLAALGVLVNILVWRRVVRST